MSALTGKRAAKLNGQGSVYESEKGSLIACLMVDVQRDDGTFLTLPYRYTLSTQDKGILTRNVSDLKAMLPEWDGADLDALFKLVVNDGATFADREVEAVCEPDERDAKYTKIKFLNIPGRASGMAAPEAGDRRAILSKFGAQFRAIGAPKRPAPKAAAPKPAAPPAPPKPSAPVKPGRESSDVDAYNALVASMAGKDEEAINAKWGEIVQSLFPNKDSEKLTPAEWGKVHDAVDNQIPF